jgi:hypothetical protein
MTDSPEHATVSVTPEFWDPVLTFWWASVPEDIRYGVRFPAEMGSLPCLEDRHGGYVPLFHVLAVLEENTDFEAACDDLPELTAGQIGAAQEFVYSALRWSAPQIDMEQLVEVYGHGKDLFEAIQARIEKAVSCSGDAGAVRSVAVPRLPVV